jgi:hypothetical protein
VSIAVLGVMRKLTVKVLSVCVLTVAGLMYSCELAADAACIQAIPKLATNRRARRAFGNERRLFIFCFPLV